MIYSILMILSTNNYILIRPYVVAFLTFFFFCCNGYPPPPRRINVFTKYYFIDFCYGEGYMILNLRIELNKLWKLFLLVYDIAYWALTSVHMMANYKISPITISLHVHYIGFIAFFYIIQKFVLNVNITLRCDCL